MLPVPAVGGPDLDRQRRPVAPARHGTVDCVPASVDHELTQSADLGRVGGGHLHPDLARTQPGEHTVIALEHRGRGGRRRQASDHDVDRLRHLARRIGPARATVEEQTSRVWCQVAHREIDAITQQRAGKLAADVSETDEPNTRAGRVERFGHATGEFRHRRNVQNIERRSESGTVQVRDAMTWAAGGWPPA